MFLFFLFFTSCLWLFIQFSKNYTKEVEVALAYVNLPEDKIVNEASDQKLKMVLNGNGFRLLNHTWRKPTLEFDVADAVVFTDKEYQFYVDKNATALVKKLNFSGKILSVQSDTVTLKLDVNLKKKLPIRFKGQVKYATGYGSDKGIEVVPDSVTISGPQSIVDTITSIQTNRLELDGLNSDYDIQIELDTTGLPPRVMITPKEVKAQVKVSKFTEGSQKIPITVQNITEGEQITIFPKEVTVVYRVGLEKYDQVSTINFKVIADYKKASQESSYLMLELTEMPDFIHDVRLQDKQVQYVILNSDK